MRTLPKTLSSLHLSSIGLSLEEQVKEEKEMLNQGTFISIQDKAMHVKEAEIKIKQKNLEIIYSSPN